MSRWRLIARVVIGSAILTPLAWGAEPTAVERGRKALHQRAFIPAMWSLTANDNAWRQWGTGRTEPPRPYEQPFMQRYGLHPAPFDNGKYPMGLREGYNLLLGKGLTADCLLCHGGSIAGKSYVGLGNSALDFQALFEELGKAGGTTSKTPFVFSNVRGTSESGSMAVFLLGFREPDLTVRYPRMDLDLRENLCEDVPAWWLLKKKKTMYHTGATDARSVRSLMQFMLNPLNPATTFQQEEATFKDIQAYLLSLEAPNYPFPIDRAVAATGEVLFNKTCSRCHGTYGDQWTYPNRIVPLDIIGTDRTRFDGITQKFGDYYNKSWFGHEKLDRPTAVAMEPTTGYQAPPLDGIWATAPYFHNGSVPTVYHVLNSKARPKFFTRSYRTDADAYDPVKLGWKVQVLAGGADPSLPGYERRKVYDTTQPGRGNSGHTFGDELTEQERLAVIEYLKTL
jgi:mono/diheme cytochrome c family protein